MSECVVTWIETWLGQRRPEETVSLTPETDLYGTGLLDSLGIIELIESLEDHYGFMFTEEEMQAGLTRVADFERIITER